MNHHIYLEDLNLKGFKKALIQTLICTLRIPYSRGCWIFPMLPCHIVCGWQAGSHIFVSIFIYIYKTVETLSLTKFTQPKILHKMQIGSTTTSVKFHMIHEVTLVVTPWVTPQESTRVHKSLGWLSLHIHDDKQNRANPTMITYKT
jgi:hypothetical protein